MSSTVSKAVQVLLQLSSASGQQSVRSIAKELAYTPSTTQRLLATLEQEGMASRDPSTNHYTLGPTALQLGATMLNRLDVRAKALPYMRRLHEATSETVGLNIQVGDSRMYVEQLESPQQLKAKAQTGHLYPLYSGSPGRILLSGLSDPEVERIIKEADLVALTAQTPVAPNDILQSVTTIREAGYAAAYGETIPGVNTIAAPLRDHRGAVCAALSISGPSSRFTTDLIEDPSSGPLTLLLEAADNISSEMGHRESAL